MLRQSGRESAKIIPFPAKRSATARDPRTAVSAPAELRAQQVPVCDYEGGWYHDAAIQETPPGRKG